MITDVKSRHIFRYKQQIHSLKEAVFPLLCPVREKDWLNDWDYRMIHSLSGLNENDCIFTTQDPGEAETLWYTTKYDPETYEVEFIRFTPGDTAVRIQINLADGLNGDTDVHISYSYTALSREAVEFLNNKGNERFLHSMHIWEKSMNHYLSTGECLR